MHMEYAWVTAMPRSALAEAIGYLLGNWQGLTAFLDDPLIPLSKNRSSDGTMHVAQVGKLRLDRPDEVGVSREQPLFFAPSS